MDNFEGYSIEETGDHSKNGLGIVIRKLKVWKPEEKSWWRKKLTKPRTIILNDVSGYIQPSSFTAIVGPSGAGKTTLLACLGSKSTLPFEGSVELDGVGISEQSQKVEIMPQSDVFVDSITVMEHMVFVTEMKLGSSRKRCNRHALRTLVKDLQLTKLARSYIGSLSGGQRRLLSLASVLISDPQILICDEPTTGLDSHSALLVIKVLKKLALSGRTVVTSVHQPSSQLFEEFSSIMVMADGRLLFQGTQMECQEFFESFDLWCPNNYNPAEFYIRAISTSSKGERVVDKMLVKSHIWDRTNNDKDSLKNYPTHRTLTTYERSWFIQVYLLVWRSSLTITREIKYHFIQLIIVVMISASIIGICFAGISGSTQRGVQDMRGFLWLLASEISYSSAYYSLHVFEEKAALYRREVGMYCCSAFFASNLISFLPRCVIWPMAFVPVATMAVELPHHALTAFKLMVVLIPGAVSSTAYGLGMGALFMSTGALSDIMPCADLPLVLLSGTFMRLSSFPIWLLPVKFLSQFYYLLDSVNNIYWRQVDFIACPTNTTSNCVQNGISVLIENGYSDDFVSQDLLGFFLVTLIWSLLGCYGLKREQRKGYAY